jgi:hypothetical protein
MLLLLLLPLAEDHPWTVRFAFFVTNPTWSYIAATVSTIYSYYLASADRTFEIILWGFAAAAFLVVGIVEHVVHKAITRCFTLEHAMIINPDYA